MSTHNHNNIEERYEFTGRVKTWSLIAIVIGVIGIIYGLVLPGHMQRTFSNLLLMSYYFVCICCAGVVFLSLWYVAQAGWSAALVRIPQAFARILPIAAVIFIIVAAAGMFTNHNVTTMVEGKMVTVSEPNLYASWTKPGITTPGNPNYDKDVVGKSAFLNKGSFFVMLVVFLGLYSIFGQSIVKSSTEEDVRGGMFFYNKNFKYAAIFLVIFGFTFPIFAFGGIMSLESHWYSTMFGWYNLAGLLVTGMSMIALLTIFLREQGYMSWITSNHLHDMGKLMFGFSIFWTYLWFSQFFLTWYANIPEEAIYFYKRWTPEYKWWFWLNIVLNFLSPLLLLMSRDAKRLFSRMKFTAILLILGHWLDYYLMIMPGTVGDGRGFFIEEIFIFIGFVGLFTYLTLNSLSKFNSLLPKNHPFLEESLHHHI